MIYPPVSRLQQCRCRTHCSRVRHFTTPSRLANHYQALDIPHNATKSQIKTSFYKMSKIHHPDVSNDPNSKIKFQSASEAYAVLGDDRKRRAYDRELNSSIHSTRHSSSHTAAQYPYSQAAYEGRRRGASHAWERTSGPQSAYHRPPPGYRGYDPGSYNYSQAQHNSHAQPQYPHNPFASSYVRRATGTKKDAQWEAEAGVRKVSGFGRFLGVLGIVMVVATIGGGATASAT